MANWTKRVGILLGLLFSLTLFAEEERHIHVNGEHLDSEDILLMDQLFKKKVNDGFYWINFQTGQWGNEGDPTVLGINKSILQIAQAAQQAAKQKNQSSQTDINMSQNGRVVSGKLNGQNCTFVSVGGTTVKSCD